MARVTVEDLNRAAEWLDSYEYDDTDPTDTAIHESHLRVIAWLDAEIARREFDAAARQVARQSGATTRQARAALRKRLDEQGGA